MELLQFWFPLEEFVIITGGLAVWREKEGLEVYIRERANVLRSANFDLVVVSLFSSEVA